MPNNSRSSGIWDSKECALFLIDYQDHVISAIGSSDTKAVVLNARYLTKAALAFEIPIVLSTVGVKLGANGPTIEALRKEIPDVPEIDRSTMDSWADANFRAAVNKTGRKKLVMAGIVTEVCLAYPVVGALKDGYEVTFVADAVGGQTRETHDVAVLRMIQAGAVPNTTSAMICEWFRDWASPLAPAARKIMVPFLNDTDVLAGRPARYAGQAEAAQH